MDKLRAISTFVAIVDNGSLTAAADSLGTSLPSVVRTLAGLERDLGVSLLTRTTRRIHLTDEGAQYLERSRGILSALRDADAALVSRQADPKGRLSVTASVLFGRRYVAPLVTAYMLRHPAVTADLLFLDRVLNIVEEGVDVAIRIGQLSDSSLIAVQVGQVRRVVCASPKYLARHGTPRSPPELKAHRCVRFTGLAARSEWSFRVGGRTVAVPITSVITCNQVDSAVEACANGLGIGSFLSYQVVGEKLKYVLEEFESEPLPINVIYPKSRMLSSNVRSFVDHCVSELRQLRYA
jgi:DNA-binding transcriptional LysR family regulator